MAELNIKCVCGETFIYSINLTPFLYEFETSGLIPLIIPHKDHFVTAYIDQSFKIRSVERVIMIDKNQKSTVVSVETMSEEEIDQILGDLKKEYNPAKDYFKFASALLYKIQEPEILFIIGKQIGYEMWQDMRKAIIRLGAMYQPDLDLILKTELKPVLDKTGKTKLDKNILEIDQCIVPQFVVGLAQGILQAIGKYAEEKMDIEIEYKIEQQKVELKLKK